MRSLFLGAWMLVGCSRLGAASSVARVDVELQLDDRYRREVVFPLIGVTIPIEAPDTYVRSDGIQPDMDAHQASLVRELGLPGVVFEGLERAPNGRHFALRFAKGEQVGFAWARADADERVARARLEHELYHALCDAHPEGRRALWAAIADLGFPVSWEGLDEELAATVVEIVGLHRAGVPLEQISGSERPEQALGILARARGQGD